MVFSSLEMQRRFIKTKLYYKLLYSVWNETFHKPLKVAAAKKSFPGAYIIDTSCFECFLFHVITERHYFLNKSIVTQRFGTTAMLLRSLLQLFWKKSAFYIRNLHNNITMLLILSKVFFSLSDWECFFYFFLKSQKLPKGMFFY